MNSFFTFILDFLFPPSSETLELRKLAAAELFTHMPPAPESPLPFITSLFAYKHPLVAELIKGIKNKKNRHSLSLGGYAFFKKLPEGKCILMPIPISDRRRRERGYNQCELLIDEILKLDVEKRFEKRCDILTRIRHTEEQKLKDRASRLSSRDIFAAKFLPITVPIILIDDVTTTGSTLKEAREVLLRVGYTNVGAFTLAH